MSISVFAAVPLPAPTILSAPKGRCSWAGWLASHFLLRITLWSNLISADYQKKSVWMIKYCLPHLTAVFMLMSSLSADQCVKLQAACLHGQREEMSICALSRSLWKWVGCWHWCYFGSTFSFYWVRVFPPSSLCKRRLSSRNPDTAHRDQNVAFFSDFLQGCCLGFDSIMQIT